MRRYCSVGLWAAVALVTASCGSLLSENQAAREANADARRAGLAGLGNGALALGPAGGTADNGADVGAAAGGVASQAAAASALAGGAGGAGGGEAGGSGLGVVTQAPPGGNGGATAVGVSTNEIKVGWVGTLTGPVPGLFRGALIGTEAAMAYQNSLGGIYGRRIRVLPGDDALDSGRNRAAHLQLKDQVFSFVGSFSVNDDGGISVLRECGCPDVGAALTRAHFALPTTFSPQPLPPGWRTGTFEYFKAHYPADVIQHVAFFVSAIESAREIAADERKVMESLGYKVVYTREVQANETNYTGDVIQMRNNGVKMLVWEGDVGNMSRLAAAMYQQGFSVTIPNWGGAMYDQSAFKIAGPAALEGALIDNVYGLFQGEDAQRLPEIALFDHWMHVVDPNQTVDLFAFYGWMSGRLWIEEAQKAGPHLTRPGILDALRSTRTWDDHGAIGPVNVGQKQPSNCWMMMRIHSGHFERYYPTDRTWDCTTGHFVYLPS